MACGRTAVSLLASECKVGHECVGGADPKGIRNQLLVAMRYDEDAGVRLKALEGLQRYVGQDPRVRDAVAEALSRDPNARGAEAGDCDAGAGAGGLDACDRCCGRFRRRMRILISGRLRTTRCRASGDLQ